MKKLSVLEFFFETISPVLIIFFAYIYKPNSHWSSYAGFGVGIIGIVLIVWYIMRLLKKQAKTIDSLRDVIVKEVNGAKQNITEEDLTAIKRKVFIFDKIRFLTPIVFVYFFTLYVEKAMRSVSVVFGLIALSLIIGAGIGYLKQGGKEDGTEE